MNESDRVWMFVLTMLGSVAAVVLALLTGDRELRLLSTLVMIGPMQYASLPMHELGHVLGAWLSRLQILGVTIGTGPTLLTRRLFNVPVQIRLWPVRGFVLAEQPAGSYWRARWALFVIAGPLMNLLLSVPGIATVPWSRAGITRIGEWFTPWQALAVANMVQFVVAMWPQQYRWPQRTVPSDGLNLLRVLQGKRVRRRIVLCSGSVPQTRRRKSKSR